MNKRRTESFVFQPGRIRLCSLGVSMLVVVISAFLLVSDSAAQDQKSEKYKISLRSRGFTPEPGISGAFKDTLGMMLGQGQSRHVIIQLDELPNQAMRRRLEARGIKLLDYIGGNAYFANISNTGALSFGPLADAADTALGLVRWMGEIESNDRVAPDVLAGEFGEKAINADGTVKIRVVFFGDVDSTVQTNVLTRYNDEFEFHSGNTWKISVERGAIDQLKTEETIMWIEQEVEPYEILNNVTRGLIGVDNVHDLNSSGSTYNGYCGTGVTAMVRDYGIDWDGSGNDHEDFQNRVPSTNTPYSGHCHGTHVAGILGGSGFRSDLNDADGNANGGTSFQWRGMAPCVELIGYSTGWDAGTYNSAISTFGADISNHSHVQSSISDYNSDAVTIENTVRDDTLYIFSAAANNGYFPQYGLLEGYFSIIGAVAKNAINIGSFNSTNGLRSDFSSMGPTFDGRIKPDIVAPGSDIRSTVYDDTHPAHAAYHDDGYGFMSGTSMASPCAAGVAALMLEAFWNEFGSGAPRPLSSTIKAILITTATDLTQSPNVPGEPNCPDFVGANAQPPFFHAGPDWATGYGLINAEAAVEMITDENLYLQDSINNPGDIDEFPVKVLDGSTSDLIVTLAWDDYPGNSATANTSPKLVNDLNLVLIEPDGITEHRPWVLAALDPADDGNIDPADITPATTGEDHLNNVEQVFVANPVSGEWTARIYESGLPQPVQNYSLAINVVAGTPPPPPPPPFGVSLHSGAAIPSGSFANVYNPGINIMFDVGYWFTRQIAVMGFFGYNDFKGKNALIDDNSVINISVNVRYYQPYQLLPMPPWSYYLGAGLGYYLVDIGDNDFGFNVGAGLDYEINPTITLEVGADYHQTFGNDIKFIHTHGGVILRF